MNLYQNDFNGYLKDTLHNFIWAAFNFREEFTKISQNKFSVYFILGN